MKQHLFVILLSLFAVVPAGARELVVRLKSGVRYSFTLSNSKLVVMTQDGSQVVIDGLSLERDAIDELRIFAQRPDDAIAVGIDDLPDEESATPTHTDEAVYDLSGRRVADDYTRFLRQKPLRGTYVIRRKKVTIQ